MYWIFMTVKQLSHKTTQFENIITIVYEQPAFLNHCHK